MITTMRLRTLILLLLLVAPAIARAGGIEGPGVVLVRAAPTKLDATIPPGCSATREIELAHQGDTPVEVRLRDADGTVDGR